MVEGEENQQPIIDCCALYSLFIKSQVYLNFYPRGLCCGYSELKGVDLTALETTLRHAVADDALQLIDDDVVYGQGKRVANASAASRDKQ